MLLLEQHLSPTHLLLPNPYYAFVKKACNLWMQIDCLHKNKLEGVMEYFAVTTLDQQILTTPTKHFITLQIPKNFPQVWKNHGYTYIHFWCHSYCINSSWKKRPSNKAISFSP